MKLSQRLHRATTGLAMCCFAATASSQSDVATPSSSQGSEKAKPPASQSGDDETNVSPRERGRVLVKRNPIASEYQEFGDLGSSPGADADGEGVDFRAFFPNANPVKGSGDSLSIGLNVNYNSLSGSVEPGGDLRFRKFFGDESRWAISGQYRSSASNRLIEHYESVWSETSYDGQSDLYLLDRPRYSYDEIYTSNETYAVQLGHKLSDRHTIFFKTYYQDYFDNFYRNRLELQFGRADIVDGSASIGADQTIIEASLTGAKTRRYFGDTDNWRVRQHHSFGGTYEGESWTIDYSVYVQRWDLDSLWYNWNFTDSGLDISYSAADPYFPVFGVDNDVDINDTSRSRFSSVRIHDSFTRDRDVAARLDAERRLQIGDQNLWIQTGLLHREKSRETGEDREVLGPNASNPFHLDLIGFDEPFGSILDGRYEQQTGLDPAKGRALVTSRPELFSRSAYSSKIESAPQSYDAEEKVSSSYLLAVSKRGPWKLQLGGRLEYTETATRGTVFIPAAVNDPDEGVLLEEVVDPSNGSISIIKDLYSANDYTNFLPSLEVAYALDEASELKASWFQLLMRPQYSNIVDYRRVSIPTQSISVGNPALEPTSIDKLRLAWTRDFEAFGNLSVEAYLINIEKFFYGAVSTEYIQEDGLPVLYRVSRVENGESGKIQGFELQWRKPIDSLPLFEKGAFELAYTFSDSEATVATRPGDTLRVPERSDHLLKASLSGVAGKFSTQLAVTFQSDALDDVGSSSEKDVTRGNVITSSVATSYAVNKQLSVSLNLGNLTDHPERSYEGSPLRVTRNQYSSWFGTFGITKTF